MSMTYIMYKINYDAMHKIKQDGLKILPTNSKLKKNY